MGIKFNLKFEQKKSKTLPEFPVWHTVQCWRRHTSKIRQYSRIKSQSSGRPHFCDGNLYKFVDKMILTMRQNSTIQSPMKCLSIRPNRQQWCEYRHRMCCVNGVKLKILNFQDCKARKKCVDSINILDNIWWLCRCGDFNVTRWTANYHRLNICHIRFGFELKTMRYDVDHIIRRWLECYIHIRIQVATVRREKSKWAICIFCLRKLELGFNYVAMTSRLTFNANPLFRTYFNWTLNVCDSETITVASCFDIVSEAPPFCWHTIRSAGMKFESIVNDDRNSILNYQIKKFMAH